NPGNIPVEVNNAPSNSQPETDVDTAPVSNGSLAIPRNTILNLELLNAVSTDIIQRGDRIQARLIEPVQFAGYIVEGRVAQVKRPGKVNVVAELQLAF